MFKQTISNSTKETFDWTTYGRTKKRFVYPKRLSEDIRYFADGLRETIPEKLKIALEAQEKLEKLRKKRIKLVINNIPENKQWFYLYLETHLFSEYFVIGEWIRYWLDIWSGINEDHVFPSRRYNQFSAIEIQKAKNYPIEDLYRDKLRKSGRRFVGLCPFHKERTPSFFIFEDNHWYCFGACSAGGDAISFAMKLHEISFPSAVRRLNGHY